MDEVTTWWIRKVAFDKCYRGRGLTAAVTGTGRDARMLLRFSEGSRCTPLHRFVLLRDDGKGNLSGESRYMWSIDQPIESSDI